MDEEYKKTLKNIKKLKEKYPNRSIVLIEYINEERKSECLRFLPSINATIDEVIISALRKIDCDKSTEAFLHVDGYELRGDKTLFQAVKDHGHEGSDILKCKIALESSLSDEEKKELGDWIKIG